MSLSARQIVQKIHAAGCRLVLAVTGGGSRAISDLLEVPGASRTLVQAVVPYSERALHEWLSGRPDQACSPATARAMAMAAFRRAAEAADAEATSTTAPPKAIGVACTAGLATDRPKLGPHRAHVAVQTAAETACWSLQLTKDARSRTEEERLVGRLVLNAVAYGAGVDRQLELSLQEGETVEQSKAAAPKPWQDLLLGKVEYVFLGASNPVTGAIFSGAFNPLHNGHRRMLAIAHEVLAMPVAVELAVANVDKPPLDYIEIQRRVEQFPADQPIWLTRAATYVDKARLFPCTTFVVGTDTLRRIADRRYYGNDAAACLSALERIASRGCKFLVFGRDMGTGFVRLSDLDLPETLRRICREVPIEAFREDVSSTSLRRAGAW
jgi:nicotinamide mononucleotide (NMN) deamidase PncC